MILAELNPNKNRVKTELDLTGKCGERMTNKKAIKWLKLELEKGVSWDDTSESTKNIREQAEVEIKEAFDMAIKALEQQPCEDCISRQAVDELSKQLVHTTRDKADFLCNFWEGLQKLPSVTPNEKTGWIPVSERLPEQGKQVLCCNKQGSVFTSAVTYIGKYYDRNTYVCFGQHCDVVAWMPLPDPFEPQENEE